MAAKEKAPRGYLRASGNETGGESARVYPGPERAPIMIALIMIGWAEIRRMETTVIDDKDLFVNERAPLIAQPIPGISATPDTLEHR